MAQNTTTPDAAQQARNAAEKAVAELLNLPGIETVLASLQDAQRQMDATDQWGTKLAQGTESAMSHLARALDFARYATH